MDPNTATTQRDEAVTRAQAILDTAEAQNRDLTVEERQEQTALLAPSDRSNRHLAIMQAANDPARVVAPHAPNVNTRTTGQPWEVRDWSNTDELRGRAEAALERMGVESDAAARALRVIDAQADSRTEAGDLARQIAATADPSYERAFGKMLRDPAAGVATFTTAEREAWERTMSIGTSADGGYAVPSSLDPSIILTNAGSANAMRQLARVVTVPVGKQWNGLSSAGVTASFDSELAEVSDDTPTLVNPNIPLYMARAFVPYSIEAGEDIANLTAELARLFADAKDRLEETKFTVGAGSTEPKGVFTAVHAVTASRVTSTTAATIGLVDLQSVYRGVPQRARRKATWLMNPVYSQAIRALGTSLSASFSGDLRDSTEGVLLGRPIIESDDAPSTQTTTALDQEMILGDFSQFVIADRIGADVELIPHLFSTANGRPTGERGMYFRWRTGSACVNTNAFRQLVDKTSA
jgi:HK97 family phage major capsid protein